MIRYLIFAVIAYILYRVVRKALGAISAPRRPNGGQVIDEMVQDPQCKTYIPRRQARRKVVGGNEHFFCSKECEEKFLNIGDTKREAQ
jgi:uncharacterized protein